MGSNPMEGVFEVKNSFFMYNTIFVYILRVPVSMKGSKGHQKSRKQRKQTGFKELAHICVLCSAIASPSLLSSSPIRVNPTRARSGTQRAFHLIQRIPRFPAPQTHRPWAYRLWRPSLVPCAGAQVPSWPWLASPSPWRRASGRARGRMRPGGRRGHLLRLRGEASPIAIGVPLGFP